MPHALEEQSIEAPANEKQIEALTTVINRLADSLASSRETVAPEVLDVHGVGQLLGVTAKTVRKMDRRGELPEPVIIGSRRKWRLKELRDWLAAGAPGREKWRTMAQAR